MKFLRRILCAFDRHDYYLVRELTPWSRKIGCRCCGRAFGMNDNVRSVIPWDRQLEQLYKDIGVI